MLLRLAAPKGMIRIKPTDIQEKYQSFLELESNSTAELDQTEVLKESNILHTLIDQRKGAMPLPKTLLQHFKTRGKNSITTTTAGFKVPEFQNE